MFALLVEPYATIQVSVLLSIRNQMNVASIFYGNSRVSTYDAKSRNTKGAINQSN